VLQEAEIERARRKPEANLDVYDLHARLPSYLCRDAARQ